MDVNVTTQIAPVAANAGLTQNISVSSPSASYFGSAGSSQIPAGQTGPGWATPSGGSSPTVPNLGAITTTIGDTSTPSWAVWAVIAALAWFALKKLGG